MGRRVERGSFFVGEGKVKVVEESRKYIWVVQ
jgi:hypothetical protein